MLPIASPTEIAARARKDTRVAAAWQAHCELTQWLGDKPSVAQATGNMAKLWCAMAAQGRLADYVQERTDHIANLPVEVDALSRDRMQKQHTALQQFTQHYGARLNAA